ncbi:hypothetical protein SUGI_0656020 [Cryptomeria japonica]|nr:hypothetical protein SUGI_0656020 [Cryptomeria japonica]
MITYNFDFQYAQLALIKYSHRIFLLHKEIFDIYPREAMQFIVLSLNRVGWACDEWPDVEDEITQSLNCFGCCFGQREDGREKWSVQRGLSRSIKWVKEYSQSVIVEAKNYCCGANTWRNVVYRLRNKNDGRRRKGGQPFQYDLYSYALNFDDGFRDKREFL